MSEDYSVKEKVEADKALKRFFGYDSFRPGQREVVEEIMFGRDVLAVMPTGSGKSVCFQLPALMMPGITKSKPHKKIFTLIKRFRQNIRITI